jgi:uncharacterized membrane protein
LLLFIKIVLIIAVVIAILAGIVFFANKAFNNRVEKEINELFENVSIGDKKVITQTDLEELPTSVKDWMHFAGVTGKERIDTVRLKQNAEMKLEEEKKMDAGRS